MNRFLFCIAAIFSFCISRAQNIQNNPGSNHGNKFEQLGTILTTPNEYRTASDAPGPRYWQQKCDYDIKCVLDEKNLKLTGSEKITYFNNSPDALSYLWLQLDENEHSSVNNANYQNASSVTPDENVTTLENLEEQKTDNGFGDKITKLTDAAGQHLQYTINKTMMRVELPAPLKPDEQFVFNIDWSYKIPDRFTQGGRGGYEYFPEDGNYLFTMAQWYPRLCVYSDFQGWQNHQFTGTGEFALTFGDFKVQMTVPADHVVGATGECQNYEETLDTKHFARWQQAQAAKEPVQIFTLDEAKAAEKQKSTSTKSWIFKATNVRDFAWTSSRKFIWDAMPAYVEGKKIMCMSYYGKEAYGLYSKFSTKLISHTVKTYSHFTFPYPYPVAQSVEAANGMEYPMICFNYGRTDKDGTYSEATKNGMIGVIIHEVGHNFFPMIVNSDERQWTWMDEGLNSFLQYLTEELYDNKFPSKRGPAWAIADYMKLPKDQLEPIMTNSENIIQFGNNAYGKPTAGLNILRETIMGRELFDYAFKTYAQRWKFKHPTPADFFRTMEDASGEDLDWFWRGWFYGTDPCDIAIDSVKAFKADLNGTPKPIKPSGKINEDETKNIDPPMLNPDDISKMRNREDKNIHFLTDVDTTLRDFYWRYDRQLEPYDSSFKYKVQPSETIALDDTTKQKFANKFLYELSFSNKGGLVMPILIQWKFTDGSTETERIPAQIWRKDEQHVTKAFLKDKEVASIQLDPYRETSDIDVNNNSFPKVGVPSNFTIFKLKQTVRGQSQGISPMQKAQEKKPF
jgi:hypothetical protein